MYPLAQGGRRTRFIRVSRLWPAPTTEAAPASWRPSCGIVATWPRCSLACCSRQAGWWWRRAASSAWSTLSCDGRVKVGYRREPFQPGVQLRGSTLLIAIRSIACVRAHAFHWHFSALASTASHGCAVAVCWTTRVPRVLGLGIIFFSKVLRGGTCSTRSCSRRLHEQHVGVGRLKARLRNQHAFTLQAANHLTSRDALGRGPN